MPLRNSAAVCWGCVLANAMFAVPTAWSTTPRSAPNPWLSETLATVGLLLVVFTLARSGRMSAAPLAVGAYITAGYWSTSSTSFANPAVTLGRTLSDTFAGIAPASVPAFIGSQLVGTLLAVGLVRLLYPTPPTWPAVSSFPPMLSSRSPRSRHD
jgi:glycerol uptake facilitator-like aquaporin